MLSEQIMLILSEKQVEGLIDIDELIAALERAHIQYSTGKAVMPVRLVVPLPQIIRQQGYYTFNEGGKDDYNFVFSLSDLYDFAPERRGWPARCRRSATPFLPRQCPRCSWSWRRKACR